MVAYKRLPSGGNYWYWPPSSIPVLVVVARVKEVEGINTDGDLFEDVGLYVPPAYTLECVPLCAYNRVVLMHLSRICHSNYPSRVTPWVSWGD